MVLTRSPTFDKSPRQMSGEDQTRQLLNKYVFSCNEYLRPELKSSNTSYKENKLKASLMLVWEQKQHWTLSKIILPRKKRGGGNTLFWQGIAFFFVTAKKIYK